MKKKDNQEKMARILHFAQDEPYVGQEILKILLNTTHQGSLKKMMETLQKKSLVWQKNLPSDEHRLPVPIWGLTTHGRRYITSPKNEFVEKKRAVVRPQHYQHTLLCQKIKIQSQNCGWKFWYPQNLVHHTHRVDGLCQSPQGLIYGIECERTIKTRERYRLILAERLQAIKKGKYESIVWISDDERIVHHLQKIMTSIDFVPILGLPVPLEKEKHYNHIICLHEKKWPAVHETIAHFESTR